MSQFHYANGELHAEGVPVSRIAKALGTPFYCYSAAALKDHYRRFAAAFADLDAQIFYSVKANSNLAVIRTLADEGAGADVVSEGELRRALAAGVPAGRVVFSGVGKTPSELAFALESGIFQFNVESESELETLSEIAAGSGATAPVAIRVNPGVDAASHHKISTGGTETKFGVAWSRAREVYIRAAGLPGVEVMGLDVHIGSQLTRLAPFETAFRRLAELARALRAEGHDVRRLDLGGGLGIAYGDEAPPSIAEYAQMIKRVVGDLDCELMLEPGRVIAADAGVLVSAVINVKDAESRRFVVLDAAMNDFARPSLYDSAHRIVPVLEPAPGTAQEPVDFVGPVCESSDSFAAHVPAPPLGAGTLVAICSAGAYGAVMASTYNSRLLVPEVLVNGDDFAVTRSRQGYDDMLAQETMPDWLSERGRAPSWGTA